MKPSKIPVAILAVLLLAVPAAAAEGPLVPGKPAGARQAAILGDFSPLLYVGLFAAAAAVIATTAGQGGTDAISTGTGTGP